MGEIYVSVWVEQLQKESAKNSVTANENKKMPVILFVAMIIALIVALIGSIFSSLSWLIMISFVILIIVAAVMVFFRHKETRQDPVKELENMEERSREHINAFLQATGLTAGDLPVVLYSVRKYREDRTASRNTFFNGAFNLIVCGLFLLGVEAIFGTNGIPEAVQQVQALMLIVAILMLMFLASEGWKMVDAIRKPSLLKIDSMIAELEFQLTSKSLLQEADVKQEYE